MGGDTLIPYLWAATGLVMLVVIVLMIHWAYAHGQFDENIKNQIFKRATMIVTAAGRGVTLRAGEWLASPARR